MVIDNENNIQLSDVKPAEHVDTSVSKSVLVTSVADADTQIVAQNIESVKTLANKITDVVYLANNIETKINSMLNKNYDGKSAVDIINTANTTFTKGMLNDISTASAISKEISSVASIRTAINKISNLEDIIIRIDNNLDVIERVGAITDDIVIVSTISAILETIVNMQQELLAIFEKLAELETIFHYLPQLLHIYTYLVDLGKAKAKLGFTDEEYLTNIIKVGKNIESMLTIAYNVDDLVAVKELLDKSPDILQNIKDEINTLLTTYSQQLDDKVTEGKKDLEDYVVDIKIEMGKILASIRAGASGNTSGITIADVFANIKAGNGVKFTRDYINQLLTIDVENVVDITAKDSTIVISKNGTTIQLNVPFFDKIKAKDKSISIEKDGDNILLSAPLDTSKFVAGDNISFDVSNNKLKISSTGGSGGTGTFSNDNFDEIVKDWNPDIVTPDNKLEISQTISNFNETINWYIN